VEMTHEFEVPVGADEAFAVLTDVPRIAPCMPGATLDESVGDEFTGRVKVKVGPVSMTYKGTATMTERDAEHHKAVILAKGQEQRGGGTAQASVTASMTALAPDRTAVTVHTDLVLTGKPAQFGRGVIAEVGDKLLGRFADCLAEELAAGESPTPEPQSEPEAGDGSGASAEAPADGNGSGPVQAVPATATATAAPARASRPANDDAIDLLDIAGGSVVKRLVPVVGVLVLAAILWRILR